MSGTAYFLGISGEQTETFSVPITDDSIVQGDHDFTVDFTINQTSNGDTLELGPNLTITIEDNDVAPANSAPIANDDDVYTTYGMPVTINTADLLSNDTDADGDSLQFQLESLPAYVTLT